MAQIDLIKKFIKIYSSAQVAIDSNNKNKAEKRYQELLTMYNAIKNSTIDYSHKKIAYTQIKKVYTGINRIDTRKTINRYAIAAAVFIMLISFAVVVKPSFFGLMVLEKGLYGNEAPFWDSTEKTFNLDGRIELDLSKYFTDPDGDELTFLTKHQKGLKIALIRDRVIIEQDGATGETPIELIATDDRIIVRETIMLNVQ